MRSQKLVTKLYLTVMLIIAIQVLLGCQNTMKVTPEKITPQKGFYEFATWSPNGKSVIYLEESNGQIEVFDLETGATRAILMSQIDVDTITSIKWISDDLIAYILIPRNKDPMVSRLMFYDMKTNKEQEYVSLEGKIYDFCWNSSSNTPVILGTGKSYSGITLAFGNKLFAYNQDHDNLQVVYQIPDSSDGIDGIACHPKNDEIAFVEISDNPIKIGNDSRLYILSEDYEKKRLLMNETDDWDFGKPTWSHDGQWIATHMYNHKGRLDGISIVPVLNNATQDTRTIWLSIDFSGATPWSPVDNILLIRSTNILGDTYLFGLDLSPWLND